MLVPIYIMVIISPVTADAGGYSDRGRHGPRWCYPWAWRTSSCYTVKCVDAAGTLFYRMLSEKLLVALLVLLLRVSLHAHDAVHGVTSACHGRRD
jgi:hypothetical protein